MARSMLSLGIEASLAFCTAWPSAALLSGSPPPSRAATVIARASLVNCWPRRASTAERLDRLVEADVEELAASDDLEAELGRFDCLVAADVLEHLGDPWRALTAFAALIEPGGRAVISLPNVRFWTTLWWVGVRG